jgi:hypothetical protein
MENIHGIFINDKKRFIKYVCTQKVGVEYIALEIFSRKRKINSEELHRILEVIRKFKLDKIKLKEAY